MIQFHQLEEKYGEQLDAMSIADVEALIPSDWMKRFLRRIDSPVNGPRFAILRNELLLAMDRRSRDQQTTMEF